MTWALKIPVRSPDDTLAEIGARGHLLPPEDRDTLRELLVTAAMVGISDARGLEQLLKDLGPQRRTVLDRLRERISEERD